jgi:hypothetical protein
MTSEIAADNSDRFPSTAPAIIDPTSSEEGPELFFGLIGAVGTDLKNVEGALSRDLQTVNYLAHDIRLSALLKECAKFKILEKADREPEHQRIRAYMDAGDDFRRTSKRGDAVSLFGDGKGSGASIRNSRRRHKTRTGTSIHF